MHSNPCVYACTMYSNLYNAPPMFYSACSINIFLGSTINFIIYVISITSRFPRHVVPYVAPRELWLKGLASPQKCCWHARASRWSDTLSVYLRSSRIKTLTKQRGITTAKASTWLQVARSANPGAYQLNVIDHRRADNPYKSRYGEACLRDHIRKDIRKAGWVCITELVRHMDKETVITLGPNWGDKYYWYHDALSQLTCKRTRSWMEKEDLLKHWLLPVGERNAGTVYFGRPVDNSPEIMPWDCSLNRDLHSCVEFYSSICRWLPKEGVKKKGGRRVSKRPDSDEVPDK